MLFRSDNDPYAATAFRDIAIAIDYARQKCAAKRIVLMGLCSGAYYAFQAAVQLSSAAIVESILINPRTYFWTDGMVLGDTGLSRANSLHYYLNTIKDPGKWRRLLSGRSNEGLIGGVKMFAQRMFPATRSASNAKIGRAHV